MPTVERKMIHLLEKIEIKEKEKAEKTFVLSFLIFVEKFASASGEERKF